MLREILAKFTVDVDVSKLANAGSKVSAMAGKVGALADAFAGERLIGFARSFVSEMVDLGDGIAATADKLGLGTTELQRWQLAANLADVETEAFNGSLGKFQKNLVAAAEGPGPAADAFNALGVAAKDASGKIRPTTDVLLDVARSVEGISDPATRNARLIDIFGKQGAALGPLMSRGAAGVEELLRTLDETGGGLTEDAIEALAGVDDATIKYEASVTSLKGKFALVFMPALSNVIDRFGRFVVALSKGENVAQRLRVVFGVLGAAGFAAGVKMLLPYAGTALLIAAIILVVDELITALKGGDSYIVDFLDMLGGEGSGKWIFSKIKEDLDPLLAKLRSMPNAAAAVEEAFSAVGAGIVRFFLEEIPEAIDLLNGQITSGAAGWVEIVIAALTPAPIFKRAIDLGKALIDGMIQGIKDNIAAFDSVSGLVLGKLEAGFEVNSPSRLLRRELAPDLAEGLVPTSDMIGSTLKSAIPRNLPSMLRGSLNVPQQNTYNVAITNGSAENVRRGMSRVHEESLRAAWEHFAERTA